MGWWWRLAGARRSTWAAAALLLSPNSHSHPAGLWNSPSVGPCCWMRPAACASSSLDGSCDAPAAKPSVPSISMSSARRRALSSRWPQPAPTACSSAGRMGYARKTSRPTWHAPEARTRRKAIQWSFFANLAPWRETVFLQSGYLELDAGAGLLSDLVSDLLSDLLSDLASLLLSACLLYTSDAADEEDSVAL